MAQLFTARQVGEVLGLPHLEIIRRIRRGDITAEKMGWNWVIKEEALEAAKQSDWFKRHQARQQQTAVAE